MVLALIVILVVGSIIFASSILYEKFGAFKWFYHDCLGWHKSDGNIKIGSAVTTSHCSICGQRIVRDKNGNWF